MVLVLSKRNVEQRSHTTISIPLINKTTNATTIPNNTNQTTNAPYL